MVPDMGANSLLLREKLHILGSLPNCGSLCVGGIFASFTRINVVLYALLQRHCYLVFRTSSEEIIPYIAVDL